MTPLHPNSQWRSAASVFALSLTLSCPTSAADLKPQTIAAFDHYVALSETKINSSLEDPPGDPQPFL
ncbi:MAG TPA: hypothetical protein VGT03_14070, partial [Candidatus Acidoferrales bacterium]|nr:hypothetical protein [Candidatus Acidoferrales bacterium]